MLLIHYVLHTAAFVLNLCFQHSLYMVLLPSSLPMRHGFPLDT